MTGVAADERWRMGVNETTNETAAEAGGMTRASLSHEILLDPDTGRACAQSRSRHVESAVGIRLDQMPSH